MKLERVLSSLEPLENRIAPAGISAVLAGGLLKIFPDGSANAMELTATVGGDGTVDLFDESASASIGSFAGVTAISILGGTLDDLISIELPTTGTAFRGDISVQPGEGINSIEISGGSILGGGGLRGDLVVKSTGSDDSVSLVGLIRGDGRISSTTGLLDLEVSGALRSLKVKGATDVDVLGTIVGKAEFRGNAGQTLDLAVAESGKIGGALKIDHPGTGDTSVLIEGDVNGAVRAVLGDGINILAVANGAALGNILAVLGGAGSDSVIITDEATVNETVQVNLGAGENAFKLDNATVDAGVKVAASKDAESNFVEFNDATVTGQVAVALPGGANDTSFTSSEIGTSIGGDVIYRGSPLIDAFRIGTDALLSGDLRVSLGNGDNLFEAQTLGDVSNFMLTAGAGIDTVSVYDPTSIFLRGTINTFGGDDAITFATLNYSRFTVNGGIGTDTLYTDPLQAALGLSILGIENLENLPVVIL